MKIFRFVKKLFFIGLTILSSFTNANSWSCVSMNNQYCKTTPQVVNVNGDEPAVFLFSIETSKCSGSCNNINYPYAKICVPDVANNLNVKVFNLTIMKQDLQNGMKHVNVSVNLEKMFVIVNNIGIKTNADMNAKN